MAELSEAELIPAEHDVKMRKAYELHELQGIPVFSIAKALGVSKSTIYNWLQEKKREFRETLETQSKADIISESLQFLQNLKLMALYEATQGNPDEDIEVAKSGLVKRKKSDYKRKLDFWILAKNIEGMKLDLMKDTGILPKVLEHIYRTISEERMEASTVEVESERSEEEIQESIIRLLSSTRSLV